MLIFWMLGCTPVNSDADETGSGGVDTADSGDTADTGEPTGPADLEIGGVAEMTTGEGDVSVTVAKKGTYIVQLVSLATAQGREYPYGDAAAEAVMAEPEPAGDRPPRAPPRSGPPLSAVAEGDERAFTVYDGYDYVTVTAKAMAVTDAVVLWEDQTTPNGLGSLDQEVVDGVLASVEELVLPRERAIFGQESDVDGDGKIAILLSYTVNMYGAVAYVTQCDIGRTAGCGSSGNNGEIVYLGVPDPEGSYGTVNGITETVAHEFNHLIYGWHRFVAQDRETAEENIYITEGMSALAQDLTGYNNGNQYVWAAALDTTDYLGPTASTDFVSVNDFLRGEGYYDADRDGTLRGASYLYLRYLFEQAGGMHVESDGTQVDDGGMAFLHAWFDSPALGEETVADVTGLALEDTIMDWYTALVCTGLVETGDPRWSYQVREMDPVTGYEYGVDPYDTIHDWLTLTGPPIQKLSRADESIRAGGVEYIEVKLDEGEAFSLAIEPRAEARARIIRVE
ncbi:hypothetical protein LBMAG42_10150 [Deltaproteobacteria bacterium]|nr:hypothetical protein LBMAG42_10150 [Deltaproteobacteria bacterium]